MTRTGSRLSAHALHALTALASGWKNAGVAQPDSRPVTERELELQNARRRFGRFLRRWRGSASWSGATAENWASACPDLFPELWPTLGRNRIGRGQWSELETGRSAKPHPVTFLQLEELNAALASDDRGVIADRALRDLVDAAQPILHESGEPWRAPDFFACWLGQLEPPEQWRPAPIQSSDIDVEETTIRLRGAWLVAVDDMGLGRGAGVQRLLRDCQPLSQQEEDDLVALTDGVAPSADRIMHVAQILQNWCARTRERLTDRVADR